MIDLCELLAARGLPLKRRAAKIIRHKDHRWDLKALIQRDQLDLYQSNQARPVIDGCKFLVSCVGESHAYAVLYGVYRVESSVRDPARQWPKEFLYQSMLPGPCWYDLKRLREYADLEGRVVINWGQGARSWCQWLTPREVVEIRPAGYTKQFPGYDNVLLSHHELRNIIHHPSANREWHRALAAVLGIYLITYLPDGRQYVGSAGGKNGLLGRWSDYAETGHGGNQLLKQLMQARPGAEADFQYSILRVLPNTSLHEEILRVEQLYMRKLGSRVHGLNH